MNREHFPCSLNQQGSFKQEEELYHGFMVAVIFDKSDNLVYLHVHNVRNWLLKPINLNLNRKWIRQRRPVSRFIYHCEEGDYYFSKCILLHCFILKKILYLIMDKRSIKIQQQWKWV